MKHKRTIATKGIKPSQKTHDTSIQSGPYKLRLWYTWNTTKSVHGQFQNLQGHNGLNHYPRPVTLVVAFSHWLCTKDTIGSHLSQSSCCVVVYIQRYCSTHWFFCSDRPSVCGWNAVLMLQLIFSSVVSVFAKWDVKHGLLSVIIFSGTLNQRNMCWRYNLAIPSPEIVVLHGRNTAALEHPWSTMVNIAS